MALSSGYDTQRHAPESMEGVPGPCRPAASVTSRRMPRLCARAVALLGLAIALAAPAPAAAQVAPQVATPERMDVPPPGFELSGDQALAIARRQEAVREEESEGGPLRPSVFITGPRRWEVNFDRGGHYLVEVDVDGVTGEVLVVWTGYQARDFLSRGHLGGTLDNPLVWGGLAILFLAPFVDLRRRRVWPDALVFIGGFGLSYALFTQGEIGWSVPLVYPVLLFLIWRLVGFARRRAGSGPPPMPAVPTAALAVALVAVFAGHVAINRAGDTRIIDVGFASVVGADRIMHGEELYTDNEIHGDTYGPINYASYIPFELAWPFTETEQSAEAAEWAALAWDLLALIGLFVLGLRARPGPEGRRLGLLLAWGWATCPFTVLALTTNTNDGLIAVLLIAVLLALRSPLLRGVLLGLGTAAKFAPAAIAPVVLRVAREERGRSVLVAAAAFAGIVIATFAVYLPDGGVRELWDTTLGFQLGREGVFSPWGQHPSLEWLATVVKVAVLGFLAWCAWLVPHQTALRTTAALGAAALIAAQLPAIHWFYLYLIWLMPLLLVAWWAPDLEHEAGTPAEA